MALCTSTNTTSQVLEALDLYYGFRHCRSVQFVDDVAGSLAGESWDVNVIDEDYTEKKYLFWLNNTVVSAPTPASNQTLFPIVYANDDDAATIAQAMIDAIEADATMNKLLKSALMTNTTDTVEYQNRFLGLVTAEVNTNAASLTFAIGQTGSGGFLGAIAQGGGTLTTEQTLLDITSDQTGSIILDQIIQGSAITFEVSLVEMTTDRWKFLVGKGFGDIETISMEELVGYGTSKLYKSAFDFAGQLTGHPVRLPLTNRSEDVTLFKATANLNSINYSGQDVQAAEMTFTSLRDQTKPESISLFGRGDHTLV